eukprot:5482134-Alexandrium_andersonii.AAC.1
MRACASNLRVAPLFLSAEGLLCMLASVIARCPSRAAQDTVVTSVSHAIVGATKPRATLAQNWRCVDHVSPLLVGAAQRRRHVRDFFHAEARRVQRSIGH